LQLLKANQRQWPVAFSADEAPDRISRAAEVNHITASLSSWFLTDGGIWCRRSCGKAAVQPAAGCCVTPVHDL